MPTRVSTSTGVDMSTHVPERSEASDQMSKVMKGAVIGKIVEQLKSEAASNSNRIPYGRRKELLELAKKHSPSITEDMIKSAYQRSMKTIPENMKSEEEVSIDSDRDKIGRPLGSTEKKQNDDKRKEMKLINDIAHEYAEARMDAKNKQKRMPN